MAMLVTTCAGVRRGSSGAGGCSSLSTGVDGTRYSSPNHRPRSMRRQRSEQNGKAEFSLRGLTGFFLLFHARVSLGAPGGSFWWQEPFLIGELEARGLPFVSSRRPLLEHAQRTGADLDDYYIDSGPGQNHYEPEANALVFEALRAGLEGRFDSADGVEQRER